MTKLRWRQVGPIALTLMMVAGAGAANAATVTLYDGSLNTAPGSQGWSSNVPAGATQTVSGGTTTLDSTSSDALQAGYARLGVPFGNRVAGYTLRFDVQVLAEDHTTSGTADNNSDGIGDRAGFSIIALGSDRTGIELSFWRADVVTTDRIWAQNEGAQKPPPTGTRFTHGEGTPFNPGTALTRYDLSFLNSTYSLYANADYSSSILTGAVRDYQNEGAPYNIPNFFFMGDNTTSANGSFRVSRVDVTDAPITPTGPVPVPFEFSPTIGLLGLGAWGLWQHRKKQLSK